MKSLSNFLQKREKVSHPIKQEYDIKIMNMFVMAHAASSCLLNHLLVGVTLKPKSREQGLIGPEALNGFLMNNIPLQNKSF